MMEELSLQEACLLDLLRVSSEAERPSTPLEVVGKLREMRYRLEELEGVEAEEFMIRPYSPKERARLVAIAQS